MIPAGARVWIALGHTDMRRGMLSLATMVQQHFTKDSFGGELWVFRGRSGSLVKIIWHDGIGMSLCAKRLEKGRFVWPSAKDGTVSLTSSQLACLLDGIDWQGPAVFVAPAERGIADDPSISGLLREVVGDSLTPMEAAVSPLPDDAEALKALLTLALQKADTAERRAAVVEAELGRRSVIAELGGADPLRVSWICPHWPGRSLVVLYRVSQRRTLH